MVPLVPTNLEAAHDVGPQVVLDRAGQRIDIHRAASGGGWEEGAGRSATIGGDIIIRPAEFEAAMEAHLLGGLIGGVACHRPDFVPLQAEVVLIVVERPTNLEV